MVFLNLRYKVHVIVDDHEAIMVLATTTVYLFNFSLYGTTYYYYYYYLIYIIIDDNIC